MKYDLTEEVELIRKGFGHIWDYELNQISKMNFFCKNNSALTHFGTVMRFI